MRAGDTELGSLSSMQYKDCPRTDGHSPHNWYDSEGNEWWCEGK